MSKLTVLDFQRMKAESRKITMLTCYDHAMARILDAAGVDLLLVGDSLGMVVQGHTTTLPVKLEHMVYHTAAVARGVSRAHVVGDLPFMSYQISPAQALESAGRLMQDGGAHSVKLEGGEDRAAAIEAIVAAGIPVMGHIGLTPQSVHALGGFKVQGKGDAAERVRRDALAVEAAGAYAVVLEGIPMELAAEITDLLTIPTIGIGAGVGCDGQVLVINDLLGMDDSFKPRFVKRYADLKAVITGAVGEYLEEVRGGAFPDEAHAFHDRPRIARVVGG